MKTDIERRKPYNFKIAMIVGYIGIAFSFIQCMAIIYSIFDYTSFQYYNLFSVLLNIFVLCCAFFFIYNYSKFKLISGISLVVLGIILICFFLNLNYYSGLVVVLSGFFGIIESMYKSGSSLKGYSYFTGQNTIYKSQKNFQNFMPEI
ncbi:MAG: hypothetical protein FWC47_13740 [Oscillospiraceae bacterium]|nr:hypothetical protein [Oscillospiraceae bacterium]